MDKMVRKSSRRRFLAGAVAGLASLAGAGMAQSPASGRRVSITIDDGPVVGAGEDLAFFQRVTAGLIECFRAERVPVVLFVNERQLNVQGQRDARAETLTQWLDAGFEIGNHTYSHINLNERPLSEYKEDVIKGEVITRSLLESRGQRLRWFRHPYLRTGHTPEIARELQAFLDQRGYTVAPVTVDYADYSFAPVYSRFLRAGDNASANRVLGAYLDQVDAGFAEAEKLSKAVLGYELPQTLLIHCNELNSVSLRDSIARMRKQGYSFVTLEEALKDPAYQRSDRYTGTRGRTWLKRWAMDEGIDLPPELTMPQWIQDLPRQG